MKRHNLLMIIFELLLFFSNIINNLLIFLNLIQKHMINLKHLEYLLLIFTFWWKFEFISTNGATYCHVLVVACFQSIVHHIIFTQHEWIVLVLWTYQVYWWIIMWIAQHADWAFNIIEELILFLWSISCRR